MSGAIVLIILIAGIILAACLTRLVNYYTFGYRRKEKEQKPELNHKDTKDTKKRL